MILPWDDISSSQLLYLLLFLTAIILMLHLLYRSHKQKLKIEQILKTLTDQHQALQQQMAANHKSTLLMLNTLGKIVQRSRKNQLVSTESTNKTSGHQVIEHAVRLAKEGASVDKIVEICEITESEAGLITRVHAPLPPS